MDKIIFPSGAAPQFYQRKIFNTTAIIIFPFISVVRTSANNNN
jgi:hypothetical protein